VAAAAVKSLLMAYLEAGSWRQMMQFAVGQVDSQLAAPMRHLQRLGKSKEKKTTKINK